MVVQDNSTLWYGHVFRDVQYWYYNAGAYSTFYGKTKPAERENETVSEYIFETCNLIEDTMENCFKSYWTDDHGNLLNPRWDSSYAYNVTSRPLYVAAKKCGGTCWYTDGIFNWAGVRYISGYAQAKTMKGW